MVDRDIRLQITAWVTDGKIRNGEGNHRRHSKNRICCGRSQTQGKNCIHKDINGRKLAVNMRHAVVGRRLALIAMEALPLLICQRSGATKGILSNSMILIKYGLLLLKCCLQAFKSQFL